MSAPKGKRITRKAFAAWLDELSPKLRFRPLSEAHCPLATFAQRDMTDARLLKAPRWQREFASRFDELRYPHTTVSACRRILRSIRP